MVVDYQDPFNRRFTALRVSLTQACNFACAYCVPAGTHLKAEPQQLKPAEFAQLVQLLVEVCGVQKIKLTGGEPLLYKNFAELLEQLSAIKVVEKSITTNATRLSQHVDALWQAGFDRVNVSLDSLNEQVFRQLSRGGQLKKTLVGIDSAVNKGMKVKLNMVPMLQYNPTEILPILDFCLDRQIECRFIELMRMGHVNQIFDDNFISMNYILNTIRKKYTVHPADSPADSTAQRFEVVDHGFFGVIPNESVPFCQSCSRLRLSSTGKLYGCLSNTHSQSIVNLLNADFKTAQQSLESVLPQVMRYKQRDAFSGSTMLMQSIGG